MTMRQVYVLLKIIGKADLVKFYLDTVSYATAHGTAKNLPSLEAFLALTSGEAPKAQNNFDEKTDKLLEEQALKRFAEMQAKNTGAKPNGG